MLILRIISYAILLTYCSVSTCQILDTAKIKLELTNKIREIAASNWGYDIETDSLRQCAERFLEISDMDGYILSQIALASYALNAGFAGEWNEKMMYVIKLTDTHQITTQPALGTYVSIYAKYQINKGEYEKAITLVKSELSRQENIYNNILKTSLLEKLSEAYLIKGEYTKASEALIPAIAEVDEMYVKGRCMAKLARVAFFEKKYNKAIDLTSESLNMLNEFKERAILFSQYYETYYERLEYLIEAKKISQAEKEFNQINDLDSLSNTILGQRSYVLSKLHLENNEYQKALDEIKKSRSLINGDIKNNTTYQLQRLKFALQENSIYLAQDNFKKSENLLSQSLLGVGVDITKDITGQINKYNYNAAIKLLRELANSKLENYSKTKKPHVLDNALSDFKKIFSVISFMNYENSDDAYIGFWAEENQRIYEEAIKASLLIGDNATALSFIEENKSNLLSKSINDRLAKQAASLPDKLQKEELDLVSTLRSLNLNFWDLNNNGFSNDSTIIKLGNEITSVQFELDSLHDFINKEYPLYLNKKQEVRNLIEVKNIQSKLDKESVIIEYFIGDNSAYAACISHNNLQVIPLNFTDSLRYNIELFSQSIRNKNIPLKEYNSYSTNIYASIVKPILNNLNRIPKNLIIIPDNYLNNLPFENLIQESSKPLFTLYNIQYQHSLKLWLQLNENNYSNYDLDFLGYAYNKSDKLYSENRSSCIEQSAGNLLCSNKEISNIQNIINSEKNKINISQSGKDIFTSEKVVKAIHLATHTCLDSTNVHKSEILLDNNTIRIEELVTNTINCELVVLSSCESGYGKIHKGEGALSIAKAFFQAGSKSAVVSLWPVDDCSTADIMKYFYQNLVSGKNKAASLANAKKEYLATAHPSRTHPYYWAGFVLIGNADPLWPQNNAFFSPLIIAALALLIAFALFIYFRSKR